MGRRRRQDHPDQLVMFPALEPKPQEPQPYIKVHVRPGRWVANVMFEGRRVKLLSGTRGGEKVAYSAGQRWIRDNWSSLSSPTP